MAEQGYSRRNKRPRIPTEAEKAKLEEFIDAIHYSDRQVYLYCDSENEYRHVHIPKGMLKVIPKDYFDPEKGTLKLLWEEEWRGLGITQVSAKRKVNGPEISLLTAIASEPGVGTLRSARARTSHSSIQAANRLPSASVV
ncbi:hypothetical protein GP486_003505 [Trichoglossum hirsutum]|uniref:Cyclin-dependent kinases regulatory subunit n=1 Tax=Trichoglossum hirsutum TaxID=265104 RepID=A0A9P8LCZ7_9PEZI|nr:hypothetical protein GP486_003505 [Trichoglossum hirsutum]